MPTLSAAMQGEGGEFNWIKSYQICLHFSWFLPLCPCYYPVLQTYRRQARWHILQKSCRLIVFWRWAPSWSVLCTIRHSALFKSEYKSMVKIQSVSFTHLMLFLPTATKREHDDKYTASLHSRKLKKLFDFFKYNFESRYFYHILDERKY